MKIGLFSDPHYSNHKEIGGGRKPYQSYEKIKNAMDTFKKSGVNICLCLGDLTDHIDGDSKEETLGNLRKILSLINSYGIPFYLVVGNHDYLALTGDDMEKEGILIPPYTVDTPEYKFVALDANYRFNMQRFDVAGVDWQDSNLPKEQIEFLEAELNNSKKPCIVLIHENLTPTIDKSHIVKNADEIRRIIRESGNVKMVIQGHYHPGNISTVDEIPYFIQNGMCEKDTDYFTVINI